LKRFKAGRSYAAKVKKGVVTTSYHGPNGLEFFYALNIPESYDPTRKYQARIQLHGGVSRETNGIRGDGSIGALSGAEQIYILPYGWDAAPWWGEAQIENMRTILDTVKRTYNVDENRVAVAGVSDGGTGAYYIAMRDMTPYASFLPLNGFIMVLPSVNAGDLFPNNLRNKPFYVVNGGRDPLYPIRAVEPYVLHLKTHGVAVEYHPQPNGVHNTAWWPDVVDSFEAFVFSHPRNPLPDTLTWQSSATRYDNRADWLIIDKLASRKGKEAPLEDVNRFGEVGEHLFDNTDANGRVDLVRTGNTVKATTRGVAELTLLLSPDVFDFSKPVRIETNGNVAFEGTVTKSVETLAKWAARDNDRTMLFGAELRIQVK
jgi:predicted esterase